MKASRVIVILCFLIPSLCTAHPFPYALMERVRDLNLAGLNHAYNFDITTANKLFDEAIGVEPLHPRAYIGKAMIFFWQYLLSKEDNDKEAFLALADHAIDAGERFEDKYGEDADVKLCLGTIYGYRSFVHGRAKSYLKGAWDGKKSYDYFYDAIQLDPKLYDAYLGIGLFHYFVTFIPKPLQWIVAVMGVTGDSDAGIREIRAAAQRGTYTKTEAQYYLAQFLPWHDGDFEDSEKILSNLCSQFPSNTLLRFTLAVWEIRRHDVRAAEEKLRTIVDTPDNDFSGVRNYAYYKLAECNFRQGSFAETLADYQTFLGRTKERTYVTTSLFRIGLCFDMLGQRDSAVEYYERAAKGDRRFGDDAYSARRAELLLKRTLSPDDTLLLAAQNAVKSGYFDRAGELFGALRSSSNLSADLAAEAVYGLGETLFERGSYAEALPVFRQIDEMKIDRELWLKPWSHYYSGLAHLKLGDAAAAKKEFEKVLEYDEYDFKNWLEFRSKRELEKLNK